MLRAALTLALLVLLGGAFVVVRSHDAVPPVAAAVAPSSTSTSAPIAVGVVSGELAGQAQRASSSVVAAESRPAPDSTEGIEAPLVAFRSSRAATTSSLVTTTTTPDTTTTSSVVTTTAPEPTTTIPETTPTTAPETTTTTTTTVATTTTTAPETTTTTTPETTTTTEALAGGVLTESQAREIFGLYFAASDVDKALSVAICESGLNTAAYNPAGYAGLFQHAIAYWDSRSASAGWEGASIYDAHANSGVAAWLVYSSGWQHWPNC